MIVYLVIIEDRDTDVEVQAFSTERLAVDYARNVATAYCTLDDGPDEDSFNPAATEGLYHALYSSEGDCVGVITRLIDEAAP